MKYSKIKMNENDLINNFSKFELEELLTIQIETENYEGAKVVKSAINQYDECGPFHISFELDDFFENVDEDEDEDDEDDE
jgi:hypothetical protein